jgi:hypothetical protein
MLHRAGTAGAVDDLYRLVGGDNEDLAVADVAFRTGPSNVYDSVDRPFQEIIIDDNFQHNLAKQLGSVLMTAIHFGPPALSAETLGIGNSQSGHLDFLQGFAHRAEFCRLDNGDNEFHDVFPYILPSPLGEGQGVRARQQYKSTYITYSPLGRGGKGCN